ncbi:hypothetical protein SEVIR_8G182000v4 [Setaria viridis]|uniref:RING-type domain-containing protein n=1 Tax=Setaria viridis TaxID=4556 RepID=A0A4V6D3D9_SETVI|nr:probable E3 ubiquitin-protein ligase RHY1A [Setaria viridis]TKW01456.1 hypothetical protein SEVIR_8G182000v2 [Setaria viridis]
MLPGVELARRRRVHYHGDAASSAAASAAEHHYHYAHAHRHAGPAAAVTGPAMAARIRLEEKLRGAALPSATSPSRWSRLIGEREGRATSERRSRRREQQQENAERGVLATAEVWPIPPAPTSAADGGHHHRRRAELTRTLSKVEVCAVCLDEVRERRQRVTRLPCSHKYHSDCVLPWLAIQPDCPCCRALVPAADTLA